MDGIIHYFSVWIIYYANSMNQDIITLVIVLATVIYTIYAITKQIAVAFNSNKTGDHHCTGCKGCALKK